MIIDINQVFRDYDRLICKYAYKVSHKSPVEFDDAKQELSILLLKYINNFDEEKGSLSGFINQTLSFSSFKIMDNAYRNYKYKNANLDNYQDQIAYDEPDADVTIDFERMLNNLDRVKAKEIIELYLKGFSATEIANIKSKCISSITNEFENVRKCIRNYFIDYDDVQPCLFVKTNNVMRQINYAH